MVFFVIPFVQITKLHFFFNRFLNNLVFMCSDSVNFSFHGSRLNLYPIFQLVFERRAYAHGELSYEKRKEGYFQRFFRRRRREEKLIGNTNVSLPVSRC